MVATHTKSVGIYLSLVPRIEALASPNCRNEQRRSPRRYVYKTVDEAVAELDKYLDDAYIAHLSPVRIVHGKGTGALRNGIHQYLRRQKHIKSFRLGAFGEGDAGVTIVEFK